MLSARHAKRSGFSEHEVADADVGISLDGIRKIEAAERPPSFNYQQIIRLARALGVEPTAQPSASSRAIEEIVVEAQFAAWLT